MTSDLVLLMFPQVTPVSASTYAFDVPHDVLYAFMHLRLFIERCVAATYSYIIPSIFQLCGRSVFFFDYVFIALHIEGFGRIQCSSKVEFGGKKAVIL